MKVRSNKIIDIFKYYSNELDGLYENKEIKNLLHLIFEEYAGLSRTDILLNTELRVNESELLKIHFAVKDLKKFKPVQYIFRKTNFLGLDFIVNPDVLIPRPETEELVSLIVKDYKYNKEEINILDIGTGSGCIAICLKKFIPFSKVYAIDNFPKALKTAKINSENSKVDIKFICLDILNKKLWKNLPQFDIIVSNPPYIRESEKELMNKNVLDYERKEFLFVPDNNPLIFYEAISDFATEHLKENGMLYFEINENFGASVVKMLEVKKIGNILLLKDIRGKDRIVKIGIKIF
jgi:release factor glutamine methyltransferase